MKKLKILIPSLIATTSMPLVAIVGCKGVSITNSKQWVVQFNTNGGSYIDTILVDDGMRIANVPEEPKRDGYKFDGWFIDKNLNIPFRFSQPITKDLTIYVAWQKTTDCTIRFTTDGGGTLSSVEPLTVKSGTKWYELVAGRDLPYPEPIDPKYSFAGWYHDETKLEDTDHIEINEDWYVTARFNKPVPKNTAYIVNCPPEISLSEQEVVIGQPFEADITAEDGYEIRKSWISSIYNSSTPIKNIDDVITVVSSNKLHLKITNPLGNIAIVINKETKFLSYICNKAEDGFEISDNEIEEGNPIIGIIHSHQNIDEQGAIKQITMNGEVVDPTYYRQIINPLDHTYAAVEIVKEGFEIKGDILIWMAPTTISWDSDDGDFPYIIEPLPAQTPAFEALYSYYLLIEENKKNFIADAMNNLFDEPSKLQKGEGYKSVDINASNLNYQIVPPSEIDMPTQILCTHDFAVYATTDSGLPYSPDVMYASIKAENVYGYVSSDAQRFPNSYSFDSLLTFLQKISPDPETAYLGIRGFLSSYHWSLTVIVGMVRGGSAQDNIILSYDSDYVSHLSDEKWDEEKDNIIQAYMSACFPHPIHYLSNIVPPLEIQSK